MKRINIFLVFILLSSVVLGQHTISAKKGIVKNAYNFWVYTPEGYDTLQEKTPIILFLHGASLCGNNLNKVRRYGPLHAIDMGRKIPALIIAPQNNGGAWQPKKLYDILEWTKNHYKIDTNRIYVLGMSLGGYGVLEFVGTYPEKIAAAMALCGGCNLKNLQPLGSLPLWIIHGTADRDVPLSQSKKIVAALQSQNNDQRLRYDWFKGVNHGGLSRLLYLEDTYRWLFAHSLKDENRKVNKEIKLHKEDMKKAYYNLSKTATKPKLID